MKKAKVIRKNGQLNIQTVLEKNETVNEQEMAIFNAKLIRGLMHPVWETQTQITYVSPDGISLDQYIRKQISKNDFFLILAQTVEVTKKIENHGFLYNGLVTDFPYVFVNEVTKEVNFIYRPINTRTISASVFVFFYNLFSQTVFAPGEDISFLPGLVDFVQRMQFYTPQELENYILQIYPDVYKQVQRQKSGQSEALYSRRLSMEAARAEMQKNPISEQTANGYAPVMPQAPVYSEETTLISDQAPIMDQAPVMPQAPMMDQAPVMPQAPMMNQAPIMDQTPIMPVQMPVEDEGTTLLNEEGTTLLEEEMGTTLLEDDGTMLLEEPQAPAPKPYLIRNINGQRYDIDQPEFKIGKDARFVRLVISDNKAVSRQHAAIVSRDEEYFLVDNNSTNKTYVNGNMLIPGQEYRLSDGDSLMLGNEGFEFHIEQ